MIIKLESIVLVILLRPDIVMKKIFLAKITFQFIMKQNSTSFTAQNGKQLIIMKISYQFKEHQMPKN